MPGGMRKPPGYEWAVFIGLLVGFLLTVGACFIALHGLHLPTALG